MPSTPKTNTTIKRMTTRSSSKAKAKAIAKEDSPNSSPSKALVVAKPRTLVKRRPGHNYMNFNETSGRQWSEMILNASTHPNRDKLKLRDLSPFYPDIPTDAAASERFRHHKGDPKMWRKARESLEMAICTGLLKTLDVRPDILSTLTLPKKDAAVGSSGPGFNVDRDLAVAAGGAGIAVATGTTGATPSRAQVETTEDILGVTSNDDDFGPPPRREDYECFYDWLEAINEHSLAMGVKYEANMIMEEEFASMAASFAPSSSSGSNPLGGGAAAATATGKGGQMSTPGTPSNSRRGGGKFSTPNRGAVHLLQQRQQMQQPLKQQQPALVEASPPLQSPEASRSTLSNGIESATKLASEGVKLASKAMDVGTKAVDVGTKAMDVGTRAMDVGTKAMDVGTKAMDVGTKAMDVGTKAMDVSKDATSLAVSALSFIQQLDNKFQGLKTTVRQNQQSNDKRLNKIENRFVLTEQDIDIGQNLVLSLVEDNAVLDPTRTSLAITLTQKMERGLASTLFASLQADPSSSLGLRLDGDTFQRSTFSMYTDMNFEQQDAAGIIAPHTHNTLLVLQQPSHSLKVPKSMSTGQTFNYSEECRYLCLPYQQFRIVRTCQVEDGIDDPITGRFKFKGKKTLLFLEENCCQQ